MSTEKDDSNNRSIIKNDTNVYSELITSVRDVRDNANRFLESLERFDNIRREVNIGSLNNFIQGILNTDYNEVEEVIAVDISSTGRQSTPASVNHLLTESFSESSVAPTKTPPVIPSIPNASSYTQIESSLDTTSTKFPIVNDASIVSDSSDISQYPRVILENCPDITTNSTTSTGSINRSRGRPRKFSNRHAIIDDRRSSQKNTSKAGSSRITGKSASASEAYYSGTSDFSLSGSAVYSDDDQMDTSSSEDDSHSERVMNLVRAYISTTRSDVLKDGVYTWKNTRPIFLNDHLVKVKKLFRNNNIPSSLNEDEDIVNAFKRIHTSRRSMYLTKQKYVHANSGSVVGNVDSGKSRGRPPKNSDKEKQSIR